MAHSFPGEDPVLAEIRATRQDINVLNVRLFGEEDGTSGEGGRLVNIEETTKSHGRRLTWLERIAYGGLGAIGTLEFLHMMGILHF